MHSPSKALESCFFILFPLDIVWISGVVLATLTLHTNYIFLRRRVTREVY